MKFEVINEKWFRIEGNTFRRLYKVKLSPNGNFKLINAKDNSILFNDLSLKNIQINGRQVTIENLEEITFVNDCRKRNKANITNPKIKIFDKTFDKTFE